MRYESRERKRYGRVLGAVQHAWKCLRNSRPQPDNVPSLVPVLLLCALASHSVAMTGAAIAIALGVSARVLFGEFVPVNARWIFGTVAATAHAINTFQNCAKNSFKLPRDPEPVIRGESEAPVRGTPPWVNVHEDAFSCALRTHIKAKIKSARRMRKRKAKRARCPVHCAYPRSLIRSCLLTLSQCACAVLAPHVPRVVCHVYASSEEGAQRQCEWLYLHYGRSWCALPLCVREHWGLICPTCNVRRCNAPGDYLIRPFVLLTYVCSLRAGP
ncbi:hypothetical protein SAMN04489731_103557 [Amycolatopsis regifaucium]|nr:hypothetical protein SAMN04489731_103557 [Amycolatopsis regifaucium]